MATIKTALVIGGGIGGLSAAIALKGQGVDVEIVEVNSHWHVYHVGIIVQANFLAALDRIGVAQRAMAAGYPYHKVHNADITGRLLFTQSPIYADSPYPANLGITRPALHEVLTSTARERGVPVRLGVSFTAIEDRGDCVHVDFTDGSSSDYDLVIGADGVRSVVRRHLFGPDMVPKFTGQGVWRYNIPRPPELTDMVMFRGKPGMTAGLVPLDERSMYVFVVNAEPGNPYFPPETLADELRHRLEGYGGELVRVREQVVDPALVVYRPLELLLVPTPWHRGRVVLLGDAAHVATPHLGQGAAMAVEDAVVLAEQIGQGADLNAALDGYAQRRLPRVKAVVDASIKIGEWEMDPSIKLDLPALFGGVFAVLAQPI